MLVRDLSAKQQEKKQQQQQPPSAQSPPKHEESIDDLEKELLSTINELESKQPVKTQTQPQAQPQAAPVVTPASPAVDNNPSTFAQRYPWFYDNMSGPEADALLGNAEVSCTLHAAFRYQKLMHVMFRKDRFLFDLAANLVILLVCVGSCLPLSSHATYNYLWNSRLLCFSVIQ
jgi:hypothetical protein